MWSCAECRIKGDYQTINADMCAGWLPGKSAFSLSFVPEHPPHCCNCAKKREWSAYDELACWHCKARQKREQQQEHLVTVLSLGLGAVSFQHLVKPHSCLTHAHSCLTHADSYLTQVSFVVKGAELVCATALSTVLLRAISLVLEDLNTRSLAGRSLVCLQNCKVEERDASDTHFLLAHWRGQQVLKARSWKVWSWACVLASQCSQPCQD